MTKKILKKRLGFTLIELLTATAIMIILVLFVTRVAVDMLKAYDRTVAVLSTNQDARTFLDPLQGDLESIKIFPDGNFWMEFRYGDAVSNVKKGEFPQIMLFSLPQDRVRRSISNPKEDLPGELCAISYKLAHKSPFEGLSDNENLVYGTYRSVLNANDTFLKALPVIMGNQSDASSRSNIPPYTFWNGATQITDPTDNVKYDALKWSTAESNFLVEGIVNVSIFFWFDDFLDGKRKLVTYNDPDVVSSLTKAYKGVSLLTFNRDLLVSAYDIVLDNAYSSPKRGVIRGAEISITVLSPAGKELLRAAQLVENNAIIDEAKYKTIVQEHGATYSRSISFLPLK